MTNTSENSSIIPIWAETTFDKLRRGTMRNLEPPKLDFSSIYFNESESTSIKNHTNSIIEPKSIICSPQLKKPKRVYKNNRKKIKSPKIILKEGHVTKNRKKPLKSKLKQMKKEVSAEKSTLPEDNILLHELVITQDRTKLWVQNSFPSITTPNFKSTSTPVFTSTPLLTTKTLNNNNLTDLSCVENPSKSKLENKLQSKVVLPRVNNDNNIQDLSGVEYLSKSELDDKFRLKCQVVLPRTASNFQDLSGVEYLSKPKSDDKINLKSLNSQDIFKRSNNNNNNSQDLSDIKNLYKSKLDDKFYRKCQVVLSRLEDQNLSGIENLCKLKLDDKVYRKCQVVLTRLEIDDKSALNSTKTPNTPLIRCDTKNENLKLPIVRLERLNIDKILQKQRNSLSLIESSFTRSSFKLRIKFRSTRNLFKTRSQSRSKSFGHLKNNICRTKQKKQNITLNPQLLVLCRKLSQEQIDILSNSTIIKSTLEDHTFQNDTKKLSNSNLEHNSSSINLNNHSPLSNSNIDHNSLSKNSNLNRHSSSLHLNLINNSNLNHHSLSANLNHHSSSVHLNSYENSNLHCHSSSVISNLINHHSLSTYSTLNDYSNFNSHSTVNENSILNHHSTSANENSSLKQPCDHSSTSINLNEKSNKENSPCINSNHNTESLINSNYTNREEFKSIKKSLINKRRGGQLSDKIKKRFISNDELTVDSTNDGLTIDLTNDNDSYDNLSDCEIIDLSSSIESISSNNSIKQKLKTPNNLHCKVLLRNFTNNITSSSTPNKSNRLSNITCSPNKNGSANITLLSTPNKLNEQSNSINQDKSLVVSSPTLPDKIYLKPGKHWQRSLSILRHTFGFKDPNDYNLMTNKKKGRKWRSTCFEIKNDNKSVCLDTCHPNSFQTKIIDDPELLTKAQPNLSDSISSKRISIRIVPAILPTTRISQKDNFSRIGDNEHNTKRSDLEIYARITQNFHRTGYVSKVDQNKIQELDDVFNDLSLDINNQSTINESVLEPSLIRSSSVDVSEYSHCVTAQDIVLKRCNQTDPLDFERCYPDSVLKKCQKLGEGVFGEVFLLKNADGSSTVLKIIPIEGSIPVNGEHQKKYDEIISEIIITQELSDLRDNALNCTECYTYVQNVRCVRGKYPTLLVELWELYDEMKGSENEHPGMFDDDQLYVVFELEHGGRDLESFEFLNAEQAYSIFIQTSLALSIAENELEFEHRDLHWGNLLIQPTDAKTIVFKLSGEQIEVNTFGVKATIIDFTLSRVTYNNVCIYNNLADDPDLFKSVGDYQFEVYKLMQQKNQNQWEHFEPYTNILWLHYVILKMIDGARYRRPKTIKHRKHISLMQSISHELLTQTSAEEFVLRFYYQEPNGYTKLI